MKRRTFIGAIGAALGALCGVKPVEAKPQTTSIVPFVRVRILPSIFFADVVSLRGDQWLPTGERLRIEWPEEWEGTYVPESGLAGCVMNIDGHWTVVSLEHRLSVAQFMSGVMTPNEARGFRLTE